MPQDHNYHGFPCMTYTSHNSLIQTSIMLSYKNLRPLLVMLIITGHIESLFEGDFASNNTKTTYNAGLD